MADAKTNFLENAIINHVLRNTPYTQPTTVYVALLTAIADGEASSWTEVTGGSYARQAVTFGAPSNGTCANSADVVFPVASANWGTIIGIAIMDAPSAGNGLYYGSLVASKTINTNDQFKFLTGSLTVQEQ